MALIECPKCGGVVSTKAQACPHCPASIDGILITQDSPHASQSANQVSLQLPEPEVTLKAKPKFTPVGVRRGGLDWSIHVGLSILSVSLVLIFVYLKVDEHFRKQRELEESRHSIQQINDSLRELKRMEQLYPEMYDKLNRTGPPKLLKRPE